jgi:hypothetical protein
MTIIRPHTKPPLWWLFPWSYARTLHMAANALKALCDRQDDLLKDKVSTRPRWSIWISGVSGPDRKYLFVDNDKQKKTSPKGITYGTAVHFHGDAWTIMKDPEDAIVFCDRLNKGEIK